MYTVYAIKSKSKNYIYVGFTNNLERRFNEHQKGRCKLTKAYRPYAIIFVKEVESRINARKLEKYYKSGVGKEFLKSL